AAGGDEEIAVGRGSNQARVAEVCGVLRDLEAFRNFRPSIGGTRSEFGAVARRLSGGGLGQGRQGYLARRGGGFEAIVGEWRGGHRKRFGAWGCLAGGCSGSGGAGSGLRGFQTFYIGDEFPAVVRREGLPGRHAVVDVAAGDVPEDF